jgi:predicted alpha/beta hydrolase family esterase
MMQNIYILHGCCDQEEFNDTSIPSGSNCHWIPWLQKQLVVRGYNCQTPEMPVPYKADYETWKNIFSIYPLDHQTSLVAHSCGCGFLLKFLSENPININKLVMVAPFIDPDGRMNDFLNFNLNPSLNDAVNSIDLFYSTDEPVSGVKRSVDAIMNTYSNIHYHEFENHGHFCSKEMGTDSFPELLDVIIG